MPCWQANAAACRAGGMIGWFGVGHEARNTPPRRRPICALPPPASLNRQKTRGGRPAGIRTTAGLFPSSQNVRSGWRSRRSPLSLTASFPDHWSGGVNCGASGGIFEVFHAAAIGGRGVPTTEPGTEVIGGWGSLHGGSGGWNGRHHSDELALFPNGASNVSNREASICSVASSRTKYVGMSGDGRAQEPLKVEWGGGDGCQFIQH